MAWVEVEATDEGGDWLFRKTRRRERAEIQRAEAMGRHQAGEVEERR